MTDQTVALDVRTSPLPPIQAFNPASSLEQATAIQAGRSQLQMFNRQNAGQDLAFRNQLIANAAAHGLDQESWDAAFRDAVQRGAPEAAQYIGRYTPLLQQRVFAAYGAPASGPAPAIAGGGNPGGAGAPPTEMLDRMYANVTPEQMATSLARNNLIMSVLATDRDPQSHVAAIQRLQAAGIPNAAALMGPYNPLQVVTLYNAAQQRAAYLQNRIAQNGIGAPAPLVKNDITTVGNVAYSMDPYRGTAKPLTPTEPKKIGVDEFGRDVFGVPDPSVPGGYRRVDTATLPSTNPGITFADAAHRIEGIENATGNPAAVNPRSTATGNGQFIDRTWLDTFKQARPDLAKTLTDPQILALRKDPMFASAMTAALAEQNATTLAKAGLPVTTSSLALAHRFGSSDAMKILNAPPATPLDQILAPKVIAANPDLKGQTAGRYVQGLIGQVGNDPVGAVAPATGTAPSVDLHGEDYLKTLPAAKANVVRMIAEGRAPFPSGFIMKTPYGQWLTQAVGQYEPGFTAAAWNARNAVRKEFSAGGPNSPAATITAGNTAIQHLGELSNAAEKLENWSGWGILNGPLNWATLKEREIAQDPRVSNFDSIRNKYIEEATKFYRGTGGNEADLQRDIAALNAAQSPEQLRQAIALQAELMERKISALQARWTQANTLSDGRVIEPPFPIVQPDSRTALARIRSRETATGSAPAAAAPAQAATAPSPGPRPVPGAKLFQGRWYTRGPNGEAVPVR